MTVLSQRRQSRKRMRWSDLIGRTYGQYRIIEEIGRGGAAHVFRAYAEEDGRQVAFKALTIETDDRVAFMQRFSREATVIRALNHSGIVHVYDTGEVDDFVYLALQLVEGGTLRQRIASERISTQAACQYMMQIARALHYAHLQGIIHRDVKPSNMLLDKEHPGRILLSDFGTAKIINAAGLTKTGATVGTPEYMSPEQAEGREVDQRSDIYSLGCALYEILAGRPPFIGTSSLSVLYQQVHAQPTYVRGYNSEAPRELWDVLRMCLAKRPDERYGSAERLAEELQPFADGLIQPTPAPWHGSVTGIPHGERGSGSQLRPLRTGQPLPDSLLPPSAPPSNPLFPGLQGLPAEGAGPFHLELGGGRAPMSRPTYPVRKAPKTLNLPSSQGGSGLLGNQNSQENKQAMAAFQSQLEAEYLAANPTGAEIDDRPTIKSPNSMPHPDVLPTEKNSAAPNSPGRRAPTSGPYRGPVSGAGFPPVGRAPSSGQYRGQTSGPLGSDMRAPTSNPASPYGVGYQRQTSGPLGGGYRSPTSRPVNGGYRSPASRPVGDGYSGSTSRPIAPPAQVAIRSRPITFADMERSPKRRSLSMPALAVVVLALLAVGVGLGIGNMKLFANQSKTTRSVIAQTKITATLPAVTPTATVAPPTATATPNPQSALNQQAASSFRALTTAPFADGSCSNGNATLHFNSGAVVFINLCMNGNPAAGPVSAVVRQNGATVRTLISNLYTSVNAYYSQGHTLPNGNYDMLVTMRINGNQAVVRDVPFTVG